MPRIIISIPDKKPQPYRLPINRQLTRFGRASENDITIDCPSVSVHHAEMERVKGGFRLRDLDSTNGTKLDGERKKTIDLREGQEIMLGDVFMEFQLSEEERETLAEETPNKNSASVSETFDEGLPEIDINEKKPRPKPVLAENPENEVDSSSQPGVLASFLLTLLFFVLVIAAFVGGMEIHHRQKTAKAPGGPHSLIGEMIEHRFQTPPPPTAEPQPSKPPVPEPTR
jgi:pSer/pThr/pTyr-binding forkhead associated (FHA) protein